AEGLTGPDQGQLMDELDASHEELRTALSWFSTQGRHGEALRLCVALGQFWDVRGHWVEGRRYLSSVLDQVTQAPVLLQARALHWIGVLAWCLGLLQESKQAHEKSLALLRSTAD